MLRSTRTASLGLLVVAASCLLVLGAGAATKAGGGSLSKEDRALLAQARMKGESTVTILVASAPGANNGVAAALEGLGGSIGFRDDLLDYIRAAVPTNRVEDAAALAGVQSLELDTVIPLPDPRPDAAQAVTPQTPPGEATPRNNPYMPIGDTGAAQFTATNPTYDGRGVTVGIIDTGISLDHPSLLTTSTGDSKVVDWVTYTHPSTDADPTWLNMAQQIVVTGGSFVLGSGAAATTYAGVPSDGQYRVAVFEESKLGAGSEFGIQCSAGPPAVAGSDVNRNGVCNEKFAVLWRTVDNKVWVDSNADRNFAGEAAMTDYKVNRDVGSFGTDNPATAVRETVPFVVQTNGRDKYVNIGIVSGAHGSHVAGIVAANQMFGGAMSGAAPGAKLVSIRVCLFVAGCTSHALIEGMIYATKQSNVDVINMSIGGLPALNDGNNTRAILYNRLIEQTNVQMFISAGNSGPGANTVGDPSVATKVMSVGSYITKASWQKNYGSDSTHADNLHGFSSRGPREDGGFKPQIVAPGSAVSTTPMWQPGGPVAGTYALPPGFSMFNGTSMASPQAAGAAALLVSAAKQSNVQTQPDQLRQAFNSSTRYMSRYGAFEQGNGLINVGSAWNLLKTNIKTVDISSSVDVNTTLSSFLAQPGKGVGIYDREGVIASQRYERRYTFIRNSGGSGAITYNLSWVGNDGTFSSASSITLGKGTPTTLNVNVNPATSGTHSAILNLDDPATTGVDYATLNTVIAAETFTAPSYTITKTGTIGRNQTTSFFFRVPAGTPALKVDLSSPLGSGDFAAAGAGQVRFLRFHPFGVGVDSNTSTNCYNPPAGAGCSTGSPLSRTVTNPQAGVWEVAIEARRTSDTENAPFMLSASILGASVSPNPDVIASATLGTPIARSYTLTNLFGTFTGRAVGTDLGSAYRARPTIANHAQQRYQVAIPAGATSLRATIGNPSDPGADLDLFVFRPNGTLAGQSADGDSEESVTVSNPAAGTWTVLVDGFAVPAGTTAYDYIDVFFKNAPTAMPPVAPFGTISLMDANAVRPAGSSWTVSGTVRANEAPDSGRVLYGNVQVRTDQNVLVGQGDVIIESVTP